MPGGHSIGAAGGSVTLIDGTGITIPPGALGATVSITGALIANPKIPGAFASAGNSYTFGPEGTQFQTPVTVTLALSSSFAAKDVVILTAPAGTTSYEMLATTVLDATHVQAQVSHFSDFYPVAPTCMDSMCGSMTKCCSCPPDYATWSCIPPSTCCK
ncbi:MAG TPA: hypothetical protein VFF06_34235 [Polyangia bacterium]|nr:hypothetical protein [Polyangia bacterium]